MSNPLSNEHSDSVVVLAPKAASASKEFIEAWKAFEEGETMPQNLSEALDALTVAHLLKKFDASLCRRIPVTDQTERERLGLPAKAEKLGPK